MLNRKINSINTEKNIVLKIQKLCREMEPFIDGCINDMHLISPIVIEPIQALKLKHMGNHNPRLHTDEILIALSICATTNPTAELAIQQLSKLRGCEAHSTVILSRVDENVFQKLGINITCEPQYQSKKLFHK